MIRCFALLLISATCAFAGDVIAVIKSPSTVYRLKGSNGAFLGQIQPSGGAISVGCDICFLCFKFFFLDKKF
jgi:hypothetical protein